jgi:ArsR family transcriptional regulator
VPTRRNIELAKQLWAVGDPMRLRLLRLLPQMADCERGNNVSALAKRLGLSQPTISHHLRVLRQAGLVTYRKMCRDVYYWIDPVAAKKMLKVLDEVFAEPPPKRARRVTRTDRSREM